MPKTVMQKGKAMADLYPDRQCTAHSKQTKVRCRNIAVAGRETCRFHGGTSKIGALSHAWKGKGLSRHIAALPERLRERYDQAKDDPDLLGFRDDVVLLEVRMSELLERIDTGEATSKWARLLEAYRQFINNERNPGMQAASLNVMSDLIGEGMRDAEAWQEISLILEQKRKLKESEIKRLVTLKQMVPVEQVINMIHVFTTLVKTHVKDEGAVATISAELARMGNVAGRQQSLGEGRRQPV